MVKWSFLRKIGLAFSVVVFFGLGLAATINLEYQSRSVGGRGKGMTVKEPWADQDGVGGKALSESRYQLRRLHHVNDDLVRHDRNGSLHKIRHKKKLRKTEKKTSKSTRNATSEIVSQKVDVHENCYTTNEVLEIIAVTCLVNFIFWFLIISFVNFYTKGQEVKYFSWDSFESSGNASDCEVKCKRGQSRRSDPDGYVVVDEMDSNFALSEGESQKDEVLDCCDEGEMKEWTTFGDCSDGSRGFKRDKRGKSRKTNSRSMENLIF